jgi:hypothetical protein
MNISRNIHEVSNYYISSQKKYDVMSKWTYLVFIIRTSNRMFPIITKLFGYPKFKRMIKTDSGLEIPEHINQI